MALLSGFNVAGSDINILGQASLAAFRDGSVLNGFSVVTPDQLGVADRFRDGNYFTNNGASAIVLQRGNEWIVAFCGTDGRDDIAQYPQLVSRAYIEHFRPLLSAVASNAPGDTRFAFTGASLGGGATNLMADIANSQYDGRFSSAKFVAFASPSITDANGILNLGFENDPVFKVIDRYADRGSSLDNVVFASAPYLAGNHDGRSPFNDYAHSARGGLEAYARLQNSAFNDRMNPDSLIILDANGGTVQDITPGRENTGAFYIGENGGDTLIGRNGGDFLEGFGGDDRLEGGSGEDQLAGGDGNDELLGGYDNDELAGGAGNDRLRGDNGDDRLFGENGRDNLEGGSGRDRLEGGSGEDELRGGEGEDELFGGSDNDRLYGDDGRDKLEGGSGNDRLEGGSGEDELRGGDNEDELVGGNQNDRLFGEDGQDKLEGGSGDDLLEGGTGGDELRGGDGSDELAGGSERDLLFGGANEDRLRGDDGDDFLFGEDGADRLEGGSGRDRLEGGTGNDTLIGGSQSDTFVFRAGFGSDRIEGFESEDVIEMSAGRFANTAALLAQARQVGGDTVIVSGGDVLTLQGVNLASLQADDFRLV